MPAHWSDDHANCRYNLVLFSDGITEACRPDQDEEFGEERLLAAVRRGQARPAASVLEEVQADLRSFTGGTTATDDITLVVARRVNPVEEG
jgi:sigma-B regulation protein RsbU (phosphoserine phosphatase)